MALITWQEFSRRQEIKSLPLHEQKKQFLWENQRRTEENWFLEAQLMNGGGGGGGFSGQGVDGPIAGATITSNVGTTTTNAAGVFTFPKKPSGPITLTGGTDAITGLPFEGELVGYPEYKTISPITTFAHYLKEASAEDSKVPTLTIGEAITKTFTDSFDYFGISLPIEDKDTILQKDYISEAIVNNNKIGISAQAITTQIEAITETVGVALDGSIIAIKSRDKGDTIPQFSTLNRKRTAYAALGRQVASQGRIIPDTITSGVVFYNPLNKRVEKGGIEFENGTALGTQLAATIQELTELSKQEQYTNNYLTTRIQAVNRAQKTTIKNETRNAVENRGLFSNINTVSTSREVEDALKQIEKDKANEIRPTLDGTPQTITGPTFYQVKKDEKTGQEVDTQLTLIREKFYYYFGTAKDLPILMRGILPKEPGGDIIYTIAEFPYTANKTTGDTSGILLDAPCTIKTESVDEETSITTTTTYTFRPYVSSKGEEFPNVGLRLSSISIVQEKPEPVTHITSSGTYTPSFVTSEGGISGKMASEVVKGGDGNRLDIKLFKTVSYKLLPTKIQGEFIFNVVDSRAGTETTVATGIKFDSKNIATFSYTTKGLKGDAIVTWTIAYAASGGGGGTVTHISSTDKTKKYTFQITNVESGILMLPVDMTISIDFKAGNILTLAASNIPGNKNTLNNILLKADPFKIGNFILSAGEEGDAFKIAAISNSFNELNVWQKSVVMGELGVQYTITISYVDA